VAEAVGEGEEGPQSGSCNRTRDGEKKKKNDANRRVGDFKGTGKKGLEADPGDGCGRLRIQGRKKNWEGMPGRSEHTFHSFPCDEKDDTQLGELGGGARPTKKRGNFFWA